MSTHKFAAFLSYSHADSESARELHLALEKFRIPANLRRRLALDSPRVRVFRDEDELAASSDLGATLKQHLENSSALIVLASPAAAQSRWVNSEIAYFLGLGRDMRVFVVRVSDEPDVMPAALTAQVAQEGVPQSQGPEPFTLKWGEGGKSKRTVVMRLLAGVLGVDYEEFRQRAAAAARLQWAAGAAAAFALVAAASYGLGLLASVRELALVNQSKRLAQMSQEQTALGDSLLGVKLALLALPGDPQSPDRPLVEDAQIALKSALEGWRPILSSVQFDAPVTAIAQQPDGKAAFVGLQDGSIWRLPIGQQVPQKVGALAGAIYQLEFSRDGALVFAAGGRTSLGAWTVAQSQKVLEQEIADYADSGIYQWAISADGRFLAVHAADIGRSIRLFDVRANKLLATIESPTRSGFPACVFIDGHYLISAWVDENAPLVVQELSSLKQVNAVSVKAQLNGCATHAPTGQIALHGFGGEVVVFSRKDNFRNGSTMRGHTEGTRVQAAAFDPSGRFLASTGADRRLFVWNSASGKRVNEAALPLPGTSLLLDLDAKHVVVTDKKGKVWTLSLQEKEPSLQPLPVSRTVVHLMNGGLAVGFAYGEKGLILQQLQQDALALPGHSQGVRSVVFSPDGQRLLTAGDDNTARLWNPQTGAQFGADMVHGGWVLSAEFSRDGRKIVTCATDASARVWDGLTGAPLVAPLKAGIQSNVEHCHFSPDGNRVVTTDEVTRIWDTATGQCLAALPVDGTVDTGCKSNYPRENTDDQDRVTQANFDPEGRLIVIASQKGVVSVRDSATFAKVAAGKHGDYVSSIRFCSKGNLLLTSSIDSTATIWGLPAMKVVKTLNAGESIRLAAFDQQCQRVVTTSDRLGAQIWNAVSGAHPRAIGGKEEDYQRADFSPDGKSVLLSYAHNLEVNFAKLVDAATGTEIRQFRMPSQVISVSSFSPMGERVATSGSNGQVFIWRLATSDNTVLEQARTFASNLPLSSDQRARFLLD